MERINLQGFTVAQLITELQNISPEAKIIVAHGKTDDGKVYHYLKFK